MSVILFGAVFYASSGYFSERFTQAGYFVKGVFDQHPNE
jgi:hypothetical protein